MAESHYNSDRPQDGHETGDLLDRDGFAEAICDLVTTVPAPFTVGVYGSWGQGKTSFMKRVGVMLGDEKYQYSGGEDLGMLSDKETRHLAEEGNPKYVAVWFDLWAHQRDANPVVSMLQAALRVLDINDGRDPELAEKGLANQAQGFAQSLVSVPSKWHARASEVWGPNYPEVLLQALGVIGVALQGTLSADVTGFLSGLVEFAKTNGVTIGKEVRSARQQAKQDKVLKDQARLAAKFEVEEAQSQLQRRFHQVLDMLSFDCDRIVFFIDDLDRCLPEVTVDLLEKIKIFLDHPKTVFVLGLDDEATRKAVAKVKSFDEYDPIRLADRETQAQSREDAMAASARVSAEGRNSMAADYLEKIIQFPFRVPPASSDSHEWFVGNAVAINLPHLLEGQKRRVTKILADASSEQNASLRQVKRLVNAFTLNDRMGRSRKRKRDDQGRPTEDDELRIFEYQPEVMAVVTAVQILWDEEYARLCRGENVNTRGDRLKYLFVDSGEKDPQFARLATSLLRKDATALGDHQTQGNVLDLESFDSKQHPYAQYVESAAGSAPAQPEPPQDKFWIVGRLETSEEYIEEAQTLAKEMGTTWDDQKEVIRKQSSGAKVTWGTGTVIWPERGAWPKPSSVRDIWRIVKFAEGKSRVLLVSDRVFWRAPYHDRYEPVTWATSFLRQELQMWMADRVGPSIEHVWPVRRDQWADMGSDQVPDGDKFFLLSAGEASELAPRRAVAMRIDDDEPTVWWLRSPGDTPEGAAVVYYDGDVSTWLRIVGSGGVGVRPALWLNLES
ncbi:MAG: KAP family NTPase [Propionibacteriaceae bacterium]|jgi:hypothetical protein|nr:KAP family NTPase [Propionibacteriaceae bacterium]